MTEADEKEFEAQIPAILAMLDLMEEKKALEHEIQKQTQTNQILTYLRARRREVPEQITEFARHEQASIYVKKARKA